MTETVRLVLVLEVTDPDDGRWTPRFRFDPMRDTYGLSGDGYDGLANAIVGAGFNVARLEQDG